MTGIELNLSDFEILEADLVEVESQAPVLTLQGRCTSNDLDQWKESFLNWLEKDGSVKWDLDKQPFEGFVCKSQAISDRSITLHIKASSAHWEADAKTQVFASQSAEPTKIASLHGFLGAFSFANGLDELSSPVLSLVRNGPSLEFLRRVVSREKKYLVVGPRECSVKRELKAAKFEGVLLAEPRFKPSSIPAKAKIVKGNFANEADIEVLSIQETSLNKYGLAMGRREFKDAPTFIVDSSLDSSQIVDNISDQAFSLEFETDQLNIRPGVSIELPKHVRFGGNRLRVAARTLSFNANEPNHKTRNYVTLKSLSPPLFHSSIGEWKFETATVVHVHDSSKSNMIGIRPDRLELAGVDHMMCSIRQRTSGEFVTPVPGDRVEFRYRTDSTEAPVLVGVITTRSRAALSENGESGSIYSSEGFAIIYDKVAKAFVVEMAGKEVLRVEESKVSVHGQFEICRQ